MKNWLLTLGAAIIALVSVSVCVCLAQEKKPDEKEARIWMKKKLEFSQNILAGLTESDFDKIRENASAMLVLGYFEKWARADRPDYKRQVSYFDFANQELARLARDKNLDGATLAYNQLTVSCVHCHNIVRDSKKK